ncbi:MAG: putative Ig domain-containing protein, partial [Candidatus Thorarchaeota archaeon]
MKGSARLIHIIVTGLVLAGLLMAGLPSQVLAQSNSTTVGTLELVPAFEHISVYSSFTGDDNGNNQAIAEYREVGSGTWMPTVHLSPDRRDQTSRSTYDIPGELYYTDNPWQNQWRGIVFWLRPNTEYEVRVTYSDPDGVTGTNAVITTITTRNDNPPSNGNTYYVSTSGSDSNQGSFTQPFRTIQHAADMVQAGDIVNIMPGTYYELVRVTTSGQPNNYITFQSHDLNNKAIIDGQRSRSQNYLIDGYDYVRIRGLDLRNVPFSGGRHGNIELRNGADDIIIEDNVITGIGGAWRAAGILVMNGDSGGTGTPCNRVLIQRNYITDGNPGADRTPRNLIAFWNEGGSGYVIRNNTLTASPYVEDGLATSTDLMKDMFVYNNYVSAGYDDGLEAEGEDINAAYWGNTLVNPWPDGGSFTRMAIGLAPVAVGPLYIFRNTLLNFGDATLKLGNSTTGRTYFYHNTIYGRGPATYGNNNQLGNLVWRNNIMHSRGTHPAAYLSGPMSVGSTEFFSSNDFDYDLWWQRDGRFAIRWNFYQGQTGALYEGVNSTTDLHAGLDPWTNDTGQEVHGINADPLLVDPANNDVRLQSASPAIDRGTVIVGINDQHSPWPYGGSAPDMGAYEYDSGPVTNRPPVLGSIGNRTVNEEELLQFTVSATDPDGDTLTYSASNLPSGAGFNAGSRTFSWTPSTGQAGTYSNVRFEVTDGSLTDLENITITVSAPGANQP